MAFTFETQMNPEEFDAFVANHPLGNLLQQTTWAKIKNNWGHFFTGVKEDGQIVLTALVLRTKKMGMELWYIPRGPVTDYTRKDVLDFYFSNLKKFANPYKVICVKFDPLVIYDSFLLADHTESKTTKDDTTKLLESLGAKHLGYTFKIAESTQPRTQAVYYYSDGWTERPSKTLKKYLQRCSNKGVTLEKGTPQQISVFADILAKTGERKGIHLRSEEYFRRMTEVYGENCAIFFSKLNQREQLEKNLAEKKRIEDDLAENPRSEKKMEPIRQTLLGLSMEIERLQENIARDGEEVYMSASMVCENGTQSELFYAGMDGNYAKYYGSYLTYLSAIRWAYDKGCVKCNFGGVEGTLDDGLTPYKNVFLPTFEEYIGEFEFPFMKLVYPLYVKGLPMVKKIIRKISK